MSEFKDSDNSGIITDEIEKKPNLPSFPADFVDFTNGEDQIIDKSFIISPGHQKLIQELAEAYTLTQENHFLIVKQLSTSARFVSNLRAGDERRIRIGFYMERNNPLIDDMRIDEVLHSHTIGDRHKGSLYGVVSQLDLVSMNNFQMDKMWVIAPFHKYSLMVVKATDQKPNIDEWYEALWIYDALFKEAPLDYDSTLSTLIELSSKFGINIFIGKIGDKKLLRAEFILEKRNKYKKPNNQKSLERAKSQADLYYLIANTMARQVLEKMIDEPKSEKLKRMSVKSIIERLREEAMKKNSATAKGALTRLQAFGIIDELFEGPVTLIPSAVASKHIEKIEKERSKFTPKQGS